MKKLFAMLVVLAMLLSMAAFAEAADLVGTWYLNEIVMGESSMSPATFGMDMTITLNEDGTASGESSLEDEVSDGTWAIDGTTVTVTLGGDAQVFEYADGKLTADMGDGMMVFGQEKAEGEAYQPGATVAAEEADFAGSWTATKVGFDGTYLDWAVLGDQLGDPLTATIEGTTLTLSGFLFSEQSLGMAYADGALIFSAEDPDSEMIAGITANLLEDGTLMLTMSMGSDAVFILEKDA